MEFHVFITVDHYIRYRKNIYFKRLYTKLSVKNKLCNIIYSMTPFLKYSFTEKNPQKSMAMSILYAQV